MGTLSKPTLKPVWRRRIQIGGAAGAGEVSKGQDRVQIPQAWDYQVDTKQQVQDERTRGGA
jgi:hypothetical protein